MSTVTLRFAPAAEHVRTARLIAVAVARRAGLEEARLDDVRLAVGEVCARAVRRSQDGLVRAAVLLEIDDEGPLIEVTVTDQADGDPVAEEEIGWALVLGLTDQASVLPGPGGTGGLVRLTWSR
jgi:anti-sigma regulatory factor (Ser/Thr protein kinase)